MSGTKISCMLVLSVLVLNKFDRAESKRLFIEKIENCGPKNILDVSGIKAINAKDFSGVVIKGKLKVKQPVTKDTMVSMKSFQLKNGKWTNAPLKSPPTSVCDMMKNDKSTYPELIKHVNLPSECPIKKGEYPVKNGKIEASSVPAMVPNGCYKIQTTAKDGAGNQISCIVVIAKVAKPSEGPEPKCQ